MKLNTSPLRLAYLGPEGTFSYFAGLECLSGSIAPQQMLACSDFLSVFQAVAEDRCSLGFVPLENSLRGTVGQCFDLFLNHDVVMIAECYARISLCLLSRTQIAPDKFSQAIRCVYSHPQPLAQSDAWLHAQLPGVPVVPVESTAAAARRAAAEPDTAALGHWKLSQLLNLHVLARAVEDEPDNWTRFVVIAKAGHSLSWPSGLCHLVGNSAGSSADNSGDSSVGSSVGTFSAPAGSREQQGARDRSSLLFTLPDAPGALAAVLDCLAQAQINMRKLESRPLRQAGGDKWKYAFFVDVECDVLAPEHAVTLDALSRCCTSLRVLGSYARGPELAAHLNESTPL